MEYYQMDENRVKLGDFINELLEFQKEHGPDITVLKACPYYGLDTPSIQFTPKGATEGASGEDFDCISF